MSSSKSLQKQSTSKKPIEDEIAASVKSYKIPRKEKETSKNILSEVAFNSREYSQDIYPIIKQNYYQRNESEKNFNYIHCYMVENPLLMNNMETKRKEMKNTKLYADKDLNVGYGFLEAENICKSGLKCGHRVFGCLGKPNLGVYLSRYSDTLTAAPLVHGVSGTFIIFKLIKGRIKMVSLQSSHLEPTPNFDCHIAKYGPNDLTTVSAARLFEALQIYLYEYDDTELRNDCRLICPMAVVTYDYGSPSAVPKDHLLWTGNIVCGDTFNASRIQLVSQSGKMKPYSLGKKIVIKKLTTVQCALKYQPIQELLSENLLTNINRRREIRLKNGLFVSVFRLTNDRNDDFTAFVKKLVENNVLGLASLPGGTFIVMFGVGELSDQIGIPRYCSTLQSLTCLVISYRSCSAGLEFVKDPYDPANLPSVAPVGHRVNPARLESIAASQIEKETATASASEAVATERISLATSPKDSEASKSREKDTISAVGIIRNVPSMSSAATVVPVNNDYANVLTIVKDPRIIRKINPLTEKVPLLKTPRPVSVSEMQGSTNLDSPSSAFGKSSDASNITPIVTHDLSFITLEDTPRSPGPEDIDERTTLPIIVPLESVKSQQPSTFRRDLTITKSTFSWSEAAKKSLEEASLRSASVSLSNKEKAIVSGAGLRPQASTASMQSTSSKVSEHRQSENDSEKDEPKLIIEENEANTSLLIRSLTPTIAFEETEPAEVEVAKLVENDSIFMDVAPEEVTPEEPPKSISGIVVPDDLVFLKTPVQEAEYVFSRFQALKESGAFAWTMKVHSQMVLKLSESKKNLDPNSVPHERVTKLLWLLTRYRTFGIVELLSRHECDVKSRAAKDYLPCVIKLKKENEKSTCVFLSNLSPDSDGAKEFSKEGIRVMNVAIFIERFLKEA